MTLPAEKPSANERDRVTDETGAVDSSSGADERPTLHFAYAAEAPTMASFDVKEVAPGTLLGAPALGFHELCSCRSLPGASLSVALVPGLRRVFETEVGEVRVETEAAVTGLDAFPGADGADVAFRFDPGAWTTIDVGVDAGEDGAVAVDNGGHAGERGHDAGYETYHTYPEYDLAVYTATRLVRIADADRPGDEPPGPSEPHDPQENP